MSIAFLIGVFAVVIAVAPHFIKQARAATRSTDRSGDGGSTSDSGASSSDCASDGGGGGDGGCD